MAQRTTLTEKQLDVLRWIGNGCPDGVMEGEFHKISAAALRNRGLITTEGHGAAWTAALTKSGRDYVKQADGPKPPIPRQANVSVTQQLVDDVIAAGGSLRVPRPTYREPQAINYARRAELAEQYGKVPEGKALKVDSLSPTELQIDLVDAYGGITIERAAVKVPERASRYHAVVRRFRDQAKRHEVSRAALPRALRILEGLVSEAERRGYTVDTVGAFESDGYGSRRDDWSGPKHGHVTITVGQDTESIRVFEQGLSPRTYWERKNSRWSHSGPSLPPLSEYEASATGRLSLALVSGYKRNGRQDTWGDKQSWTLEEKLADLLHEIEVRAVEAVQRRDEAERQAQERQRQWEAAMQQAREDYAESRRADVLLEDVTRWRTVTDIRAYCDAAEAAYPDEPEVKAWIAWARHHAEATDPLATAPTMPAPPESVPPDELRPFLQG